jgi:hypothetical protein
MQNIRIERVIVDVAERFGLEPKALKAKTRSASVVRARHLAMLVARDLVKASFPEIGRAFGERDHTTAMAGCAHARKMLLSDAWVFEVYGSVVRGHDNGKSALLAELECLNATIERCRARAAEIAALVPVEAEAAE